MFGLRIEIWRSKKKRIKKVRQNAIGNISSILKTGIL